MKHAFEQAVRDRLDDQRKTITAEEDAFGFAEVGDTVQWGEPVYGKHVLISAAPRGKTKRVFRDGGIAVTPDGGGPTVKLKAWEYTVLSREY